MKVAVTTLTRSLSTAAPCLRAIIKGRKRDREREEGIKEADSKSDGNQCAKSSKSCQAVGLLIHVRDIALLSDELKTVNDRRVARKPGGTILYVMQHLERIRVPLRFTERPRRMQLPKTVTTLLQFKIFSILSEQI